MTSGPFAAKGYGLNPLWANVIAGMMHPPSKDEYKYRVFISYSHQDAELVGRIASILEDNGLQPMLDTTFSSEGGFIRKSALSFAGQPAHLLNSVENLQKNRTRQLDTL